MNESIDWINWFALACAILALGAVIVLPSRFFNGNSSGVRIPVWIAVPVPLAIYGIFAWMMISDLLQAESTVRLITIAVAIATLTILVLRWIYLSLSISLKHQKEKEAVE